jgi:HEPN domain-containing protein
MRGSSRQWIAFADENLSAARLLLDHLLLNACLHNIQQAVEKYLKAILIHFEKPFKKTHSIRELIIILSRHDIHIEISEDDVDFLDSIYLPSKYPLGSALPDFNPDETICKNALTVAEHIQSQVFQKTAP